MPHQGRLWTGRGRVVLLDRTEVEPGLEEGASGQRRLAWPGAEKMGPTEGRARAPPTACLAQGAKNAGERSQPAERLWCPTRGPVLAAVGFKGNLRAFRTGTSQDVYSSNFVFILSLYKKGNYHELYITKVSTSDPCFLNYSVYNSILEQIFPWDLM